MRRKNKIILYLMLVVLILVSGLLVVIKYKEIQIEKRIVDVRIYYKDKYNKKLGKETVVIIDGEVIEEENAIIEIEDIKYISVQFIKKYVDKYIYEDKESGKVIITDSNTVSIYDIGEEVYRVNDSTLNLNIPLRVENDKAYLPYSLVKNLYNVKLEELNKYGIIEVILNGKEKTVGEIAGKKTYLTYNPDKKGKIAILLKKGEKIKVLSTIEDVDGIQYRKVMNKDGILGYVREKGIINKKIIKNEKKKREEKNIEQRKIEGKIVLLWDQVFNTTANNLKSRRKTHEGVTVLSPTWFTFNENTLDGELVNISGKEYVDFAHANGYEVWPLLTDIPSGKVEGVGNIASKILPHTEKREYIIEQIMRYIEIYDLDGINMDLEFVNEDIIDDYIQFLRELYPKMKEKGKILSVDVYTPSPWSMYYKRDEIAETADYIAVMTYDEYTGGSTNSGPVASRGFVEKGVLDMLDEVPKEKILMGIPFYTRVWRFEQLKNKTKRTITNFGMNSGKDFFTSRGGELVWDEETGYFYSEVADVEYGNIVRYEAWLETIRSINIKLEIFKENDLGGIALWKRGLEDEDVWETIKSAVE